MKEQIKTIETLISNAKYEAAIESISALLEKENRSDLEHLFISIRSRFSLLKASKERNLLNFEQISIEYSKITTDLLHFLNQIKEKPKGKKTLQEDYRKPISFDKIGMLSKDEIKAYLNLYKSEIRNTPEDSELFFCIGLVYLHLQLFDLSINNFAKAINYSPEQADYYYYLALAKVRGRALKQLILPEVREIEQLLFTAIRLNNKKAKYYYCSLILKDEYYDQNGLRIPEPSIEQLQSKVAKAIKDTWELKRMMNILNLKDHKFLSNFN